MQSDNIQSDESEDITITSNSSNINSNSSNITCTIFNSETGQICGERSGLEILNEFRKLYEERLRDVDYSGDNNVETKMKIMMEWLEDLDAQNAMLVKTVEELEEAACHRVKMLEEKLKSTSTILSENMTHGMQLDDNKTLTSFSQRIDQLEENEEIYKQKIWQLESDIGSLIEIIKRGQKNDWRFNDLTFHIIDPNTLPIPDSHSYEEENQVNQEQNSTKKLRLILKFNGTLAEKYPSIYMISTNINFSNYPRKTESQLSLS